MDLSVEKAYRQASDFVVRILNGAKPADLPVLQSSKFEFVIKLKAAKRLSIDVHRLPDLREEIAQCERHGKFTTPAWCATSI